MTEFSSSHQRASAIEEACLVVARHYHGTKGEWERIRGQLHPIHARQRREMRLSDKTDI